MSIKRLEFSHKTVFGIVMRHSEFTAELEMEVDKIRQNKKWRDEIMTYEQEWENEKDSLCRQWKEEGLEEGLDQALIRPILNTLPRCSRMAQLAMKSYHLS